MVPYATLRLRLFPHLRWGFANYSIIDDTVYADYVVDCRQDYGWLIH